MNRISANALSLSDPGQKFAHGLVWTDAFRHAGKILFACFLCLMLVPAWSQTTLNPVADTDSQSDVAAGTNATLNASQWNQLFLRFDLSSISGTVTDARLRIYQTSTSGAYTLNVNTTSTDSWSEGGTKPSIGTLITSGAGRTTAGYVEINITAHVQAKMGGNKIASLGLTTNLGTWTPFFSRQNASNKPQLVITTSGSSGGSSINPVADTDSQSDVAAGTNATLNASMWNQLYVRFDLSSVTGSVSDARFRIYQTSTSGAYTLNVNTTTTDSWSEGGTKPSVGTLITSAAGRTTAGYVEVNITAHVQSKMSGNKIVSLGLTTDLGSWTPFFSRQNATNKPVLVITTGGTSTSLSASPSSLNFGTSASSQNVTVTSNTSWTVTKDQSWISVTPSSGSGNATVSVSVAANTGTARSGNVTISGGGITQGVTVSQSGSSSSSSMKVGTNFWQIGWLDRTNHFQSGVNWTTTTNPWNPTFLADLAPFSNLRFMDWGPTNNSTVTSWSQRIQKTADHYSTDGVAFEWMIDLCNRTGKDMWVNVPHQADANFWTQLATLIKNTLNTNLKVYVEYSNETWNGGFTQFQYTIDQGTANGLPGSNQWYQGGAYSVWQSLKIFKAFRDVFGSQMSSRVVRVCSFSGNFDIFDQAYNNVVNSASWNPNGEAADVLAVAPYVGANLDGGSASIQSQFHNEINNVLNNYVLPAKTIANKYGKPLICYEGGQHLLTNAHLWSRNPAIYNEYRYMLDQWKQQFTFFSHYNLYSSYASGGAWGSKESASESISQAHKYRALVDWIGANGGRLRTSADAVHEQGEPEQPSEEGVSIHPNPSAGQATIGLSNNYRGPVAITIMNVRGELLTDFQDVKSSQQAEWHVNTSDYSPGLYVIRLQADKRYVRKFVKQ